MLKKELGQYYTKKNPFLNEAFISWISKIDSIYNKKIIEPFAGSNNIIKMLDEIFPDLEKNWASFDIAPSAENFFPKVKTEKRNTIENFPKGYDIAITNPPYLAKNSAKRMGLKVDMKGFVDLYQLSLKVMLDNVDYVVAIVPDSFLTSNFNKERLERVLIINQEIFEDTKHPVCLVMFGPLKSNYFEVYNLEKHIMKIEKKKSKKSKRLHAFKFNEPNGEIGLHGVDNTKSSSIKFVQGHTIEKNKIKASSRSITRISLPPEFKNIDINLFIKIANETLFEYRRKTEDVFLTSFKGLRKDGKYRKRLDYKTANEILNTALKKLNKNGYNDRYL